MLTIRKCREDHVVDFAAEELKKYLQMILLHCGEVQIVSGDGADGFRLGLLEDFGAPFEGKDAVLDDVVHIETTENGGVLAGSNPRSVLFAVYRYLKLCGCRFYAPGPDGEYVPAKDALAPQSYHKMAEFRLRGHTVEGSPSIGNVLDYLDYHAKQELNTFALLQTHYHIRSAYNHDLLTAHNPPEPVSYENCKQWDRMLEAEAQKRGQHLRGGSHDFIPQVYDISPGDRERYKSGELKPTEEMKSRMAMLDGKRDLFRSDPIFTNFCMSREDLQDKYVGLVVDFIHKNPQYAGVSCALADLPRNHCECENCRKLRPTDFLVQMLNKIDAVLTAEGNPTRLSFSSYVDQQFPPIKERLNNPDRFMMCYPPISRTYAASINENSVFPPVQDYVRNNWTSPHSVEEGLSYFKEWQKIFHGECFTFEYHFYVHQYRDPGMMSMTRRMIADIRSLKLLKMDGYVEDGSNKSFFPNGLLSYIYAQGLLDENLDLDAEIRDYFTTCYGADWQQALDYFETMSKLFDHAYMCGDRPTDKTKSIYYDPARLKNFDDIIALAAKGREMAEKHTAMPERIQTLHWKLMHWHAAWCVGIAEAMKEKCVGNDEAAQQRWKEFADDFSRYDPILERWFDMSLGVRSFKRVMLAQQPTKDF